MSQADQLGAMLGITIGLVVDTEDPDGLNRVKLNYPLLGTEILSNWAPVASFMAGSAYGGFFHPQEGNEVLVGFLNGNPNIPYVLGSVWNGIDRPPVPMAQQNTISKIQTPGGHVITFDESEEAPSLTISDKANNKIVIDQKANTISVSAGSGITIKAVEGAVSISAPEVSITGETSLSIKSEEINVTASAALNLRGSVINLN